MIESWMRDVHTVLSFRARLRWLEKYVSLMDEDSLSNLFLNYWREKCSLWDCGCSGCMRRERNSTVLLNICWDELVKRGWSQLHVVDGRLYGKRLDLDVVSAV